MSPFHNRMGIVTLAVAAAVLLLGAGCQKAQENRSPILDQGTSAPPSAGPDASGQLPTTWAEYRSEKLGITIPYPEGWSTREDYDGEVLRFDMNPTELPSLEVANDAKAAVGVTIGNFSLNDAVLAYGPSAIQEAALIGGREVTKVIFEAEYSTPGELDRFEVYLWETGKGTHRVSGDSGDPTLQYVVETLASEVR